MDTIDRILDLQAKAHISNKDLESAANLANGSVTNWKKRRYSPGVDAIINLAQYFQVSSDYLLCLSDIPSYGGIGNSISEEERLLIEAYRSANVQGRFNIIHACMTERQEKGQAVAG